MVTLAELLEQKRREHTEASAKMFGGISQGAAQQNQQVQQAVTTAESNKINPVNIAASAIPALIASGNPLVALAAGVSAGRGSTDIAKNAISGVGQGIAGQFLGKAPDLETLPGAIPSTGGVAGYGGTEAVSGMAQGASKEIPIDVVSNTFRNLSDTSHAQQMTGFLKTLGAPEQVTNALQTLNEYGTSKKVDSFTNGLQDLKAQYTSGTLPRLEAVSQATKLKQDLMSSGIGEKDMKMANEETDKFLNTMIAAQKTEKADESKQDKKDNPKITLKDYYDSSGKHHVVGYDEQGNYVKADGKKVDANYEVPEDWSTSKPSKSDRVADEKEKDKQVSRRDKYASQYDKKVEQYLKTHHGHIEDYKQFRDDYINKAMKGDTPYFEDFFISKSDGKPKQKEKKKGLLSELLNSGHEDNKQKSKYDPSKANEVMSASTNYVFLKNGKKLTHQEAKDQGYVE